MAEDRRQRNAEITLREVQVRMAEASRLDLDQDLPPLRRVELDLANVEFSLAPVENGGLAVVSGHDLPHLY